MNTNMNKKLIVFDLNGILIKRQYDPSKKLIIKNSKRFGNHLIFKIEDINFHRLSEYFDIAVWSSMSLNNMNKYMTYIFGSFQKDIKFVFSQNECYKIPNSEDKNGKPLFIKDINEILQKFTYSPNDIIFIDDSPEKIPYGRRIDPMDYKDRELIDYLSLNIL